MADVRKFSNKRKAHGLHLAILPMPDKTYRAYDYARIGLVPILREWQENCEKMRRQCRISQFREVA